MALSSRLIHRSLNSFSVLHRSLAAASAIGALSSSSSSALRVPSLSKQSLASSQWPLLLQSRQFRPSPVSLSSSSSASEVGFEPNYTWSYEELKPRELGIDSIAGCDLNHWLIVIDFKDPRPSPEEMVRSYEETCAKALDISVEEAKRKIYACSTSNYTGFHVEVTEIESEKFNGQPGVVFVLPDSYVDPEKKEYGGDKYINGVIIPRPRSILNGKRNREQPKHGQQAGPMPNEQVNPSYPQERPTPGGLKPNLQTNPSNSQQGPTPQSYPPKQSYGLPGEGERRGPPNYPSQQNYGRPRLGEGYVPPDSYVPPKPQDYSFGQNYNPLGQGERREHMSMVASAVRNHYQHGNGGLNPSYSENYNRGDPWNFYRQEQRGFPPVDQRYCAPPRQQGDFRDDYRYYGPPQGTSYGYGIGGYRAQGPPEPYWQGPDSGCVQQGTTFSYMEDYPGHNQGQRFSQQAERNMQGANFYPQEQREFVQGYQSNHAPRYQGHFRADNQNYGPARETFYGVGGYRGHGAAEAYWQGATSRAVVQGTSYGYEQGYPWQIQGHNLSQEQLRNMQGGHYYSQEYRAFPQGGQANYIPRRQGDFRNDYRHYGPPQGTPYGHGVGEYQGHVASIAYWQGPKY